MKKKGTFITFEGPEGSGKSTQARLLHKFLQRERIACVLTREPGGTAVGDKIRTILLEKKNKGMNEVCELLLFEAARAQITRQIIIPALRKGKVVICDRFADATVAYQGYGAGLGAGLIEKLNTLAADAVRPDITILLDINPTAGLRRTLKNRRPDRMEAKSLRFHRRLRNGYLQIARREPQRIKVLNAADDIHVLHKTIRTFIIQCLSKK